MRLNDRWILIKRSSSTTHHVYTVHKRRYSYFDYCRWAADMCSNNLFKFIMWRRATTWEIDTSLTYFTLEHWSRSRLCTMITFGCFHPSTVWSVEWLMLSGWSGPSVRNWWVPQSVDSRLWRYHHPSRCTHILIRFKVDRCRWRHRNHPKTQQHCQTPQCNAIYRLWCLDKQKKNSSSHNITRPSGAISHQSTNFHHLTCAENVISPIWRTASERPRTARIQNKVNCIFHHDE